MKTLLILFASVLAASAITVTIPLKDFRVQSPAARDCIITPMTLAPTNGVVPIYDPWPAASDADGIVTLDSMMPGTYQLDVLAPPRNTTVYFLVDPTNQVQNAATNLIAQTNHVFPGNGYAWSAQASDLRYVRTGTGSDYVITNNWKGAPLVFDARNWSTNAYGGKLIILGDGSSRIQGQGASAINSASTAFGYATASGLASTAFGLNSVASGRDSLAFAYGVASGEDSFAGVYATASGYKSIALGQYSQATNDYSFVWSSAPNFINDNGDMVAVGVGSDSNYTFTVSAPAFRFLNGTIYG
ncbi:MAG: hypothetical protein WCH84_11620, partial [Verrucomicrobiota bacterium]